MVEPGGSPLMPEVSEITGQALEDLARAQAFEAELSRYNRDDLVELCVQERITRAVQVRRLMDILYEHGVAVHGFPPCAWGDPCDEDGDEDMLDLEELEMELGRPPSEEDLDEYIKARESGCRELSYDDIVDIARGADS